MRYLTAILLMQMLMLSAWPGKAMMALVTNDEQVGTADLIVIGTVAGTRELPGLPSWQAGEAVLNIEKILKGTPATKQITIRYPIPPKTEPGVVIMDHGGMVLNVGERRLFALQRAQGGYTIVGGSQGVHMATDEATFATLIREQSLVMTLDAPTGPIIFDQPLTVHVTLANTGKSDYTLYQASFEGFFLSERMGLMLTLREERQAMMVLDRTATAEKMVVKAGTKYQRAFKIIASLPASWQFLGPDTYIQTPGLIRARVFVQPSTAADARGGAIGFHVASPWVLAMIGYPLPPAVP